MTRPHPVEGKARTRKPARDVAHEFTNCHSTGDAGDHGRACDRLTAAIEARDREIVEACERAIGKLPVVGIAVAPYIAALVAARRAVLDLAHPPGGSK